MNTMPKVGDKVRRLTATKEQTLSGHVTKIGAPALPGEEPQVFWFQVTHIDGKPRVPGMYDSPITSHISEAEVSA